MASCPRLRPAALLRASLSRSELTPAPVDLRLLAVAADDLEALVSLRLVATGSSSSLIWLRWAMVSSLIGLILDSATVSSHLLGRVSPCCFDTSRLIDAEKRNGSLEVVDVSSRIRDRWLAQCLGRGLGLGDPRRKLHIFLGGFLN